MDLINCKNCGKLTLKKNSSYCDSCIQDQLEYIKKIKNYISENPKATILELHNSTGIPLNTINNLIKDRIIELF